MSSRNRTSGFTLVELMIVVACIGMLVLLMLPAIQTARAAARRSVCSSNMRQVGIATLGFANARDGQFPYSRHSHSVEEAWIYQLSEFLEDVDEIRLCPDDPRREEKLDQNHTSYLLSGYVTYKAPGSILNLNEMPETSKTIIAYEASDNLSLSTYNEHTHSPTWFASWKRDKDKVWNKIVAEVETDRHFSGAHYLYADGHVEFIPEEQVHEWVYNEPGYNFALPPQAGGRRELFP